MKTIGLVGGVASGKSAVARELAEQGAVVLDADQLAHEVLQQPQVVELLSERWGEGVQNSTGQLDRPKIAERVFGDHASAATERAYLESVLHPRIRQLVEAELAAATGRDVPAVVIDAPLLVEAGWTSLCDFVVFVDSPASLRAERAALRGWNSGEIARREAAQLPIELKRTAASHVIPNDGTLDQLQNCVRSFWDEQIVP